MWSDQLRTIQPLTDISIISASCKPVTLVMEFEVGSLTVEMRSFIRGYHIYKEVRSSITGEVLVCHLDTRILLLIYI